MQLQRRIAMKVIEQGLDPKVPCLLDKHGNITQKTKKASTSEVSSEVVNVFVKTEEKLPAVEELVQKELEKEKTEVQDTELTANEESIQVSEETFQNATKTGKSKFSKKK